MRATPALVLALLAACSSVAEPGVFAVAPDLDEPFTLRVGEAARIDAAGLSIRFISVPTDSRCPSNALILCVWEGDAGVAIELAPLQGDAALDTLHTTLDPKSRNVGVGRLRLQRLDPYPEDVTPIPDGEYRATFIVEEHA
jgi:hypothetical protein